MINPNLDKDWKRIMRLQKKKDFMPDMEEVTFMKEEISKTAVEYEAVWHIKNGTILIREKVKDMGINPHAWNPVATLPATKISALEQLQKGTLERTDCQTELEDSVIELVCQYLKIPCPSDILSGKKKLAA